MSETLYKQLRDELYKLIARQLEVSTLADTQRNVNRCIARIHEIYQKHGH